MFALIQTFNSLENFGYDSFHVCSNEDLQKKLPIFGKIIVIRAIMCHIFWAYHINSCT